MIKKTKIIISAISVLMLSALFVSCDYVIPFQKFLINTEVDETLNQKEVKVSGMDIAKTSINVKDIETYTALTNNFIEKLKDSDSIYAVSKTPSKLYPIFKGIFTDEYIKSLTNGQDDNLGVVIDDLFKDINMNIVSGSLIQVSYTLEGKKITFEIAGENGDLGYHIQRFDATLKNDKISKLKVVGAVNNTDNTTTPLTENSVLKDNTEFISAFELFKKSLKNEELYNKMINKEITDETTILGFLNEIPVVNKNNDDLKNIFITAKGNLIDYGIVSIDYNDIDAKAETIYTIGLPKAEKPLYFKLYFNRSNNKINKIEVLK